jgi:hypothetical protein
MINEFGFLVVILIYVALFTWAFRALPGENWQFVASVPRYKDRKGEWIGTNLTYYGVFMAGGVTIGVGTGVILMGSLKVPLIVIGSLFSVLLILCVPTAKLIAKMVEAKANTFTVGGAAFVGVLIAPWIILFSNLLLKNLLQFEIPLLPTLAILAISYAFGEGTGRLACISFGCCYGKPLHEESCGVPKFFSRFNFSFRGTTKKASYEGGLEAVPVIPIQGITSVVLVGTGLLGTLFFLEGHMTIAFIGTWMLTQLWRALSEFFRADFRGKGKFSVYQILALVGALYGIIAALLLSNNEWVRPDLLNGLRTFWNPGVILAIQGVWLIIFLYSGRSKVTASTLHFSVLRDQI